MARPTDEEILAMAKQAGNLVRWDMLVKDMNKVELAALYWQDGVSKQIDYHTATITAATDDVEETTREAEAAGFRVKITRQNVGGSTDYVVHVEPVETPPE